jgi:Uma2 family endonuclease
MSTVPQSDPHVVFLSDVDWETYEKLRASDRNRNLRMTYDDGDLELMSPSRLHERIAELLALFIRIWAEEGDIPLQGSGSMTFKRKDLKKGFEPDKCFYIQHEAEVRDRDELDFQFDPPPDLAIEVDVHSSSSSRMPLYAVIRVPEIWRWKDELIQVFKFTPKGRYLARSASRCLPGFPLDQAAQLLSRRQEKDETSLAREFRNLVRQQRG